jgi:hypothetical protein
LKELKDKKVDKVDDKKVKEVSKLDLSEDYKIIDEVKSI